MTAVMTAFHEYMYASAMLTLVETAGTFYMLQVCMQGILFLKKLEISVSFL